MAYRTPQRLHPLIQELTLLKFDGYSGYDIAEIEAKWGARLFQTFEEWLAGQTMAISDDGRMIVYPCDAHIFAHGLPVLD
jgi:hypothetical protein